MWGCVLQDKGHLHEAAENIQEYVRGGFSSLQYGTIDYLPCYAAAGLLVKLGMIHTCGKVWFYHILLVVHVCLQ